jgi:hypothetical protein
MKKTVLAAFVLISLVPAQSQRWAYTYDGPGKLWDQAWKVVARPDTTIYVCGDAQQSTIPFTFDITVIGLTSAGSQRWLYSYDGPGLLADQCLDLFAGADGNLYGCGSSYDLATGSDFTMFSLADTGPKRWVYRYATAGTDVAKAVTMTVDGFVCAAGYSGDDSCFTVLSMLPCGHENWLTRLPRGGAQAIIAAPDTTLYVAGYLADSATGGQTDLGVVRLWRDGTPHWVYRYDGPGHAGDSAWAMQLSDNGRLYVAGLSNNGTDDDFTVVCLNAADGHEEWVYRLDCGGVDIASSVALGPFGEVYAGGLTQIAGGGFAFTVVSLNSQGGANWVLQDTGGHAAALNIASALVCDDEGGVYACGELAGTIETRSDAAVLSIAENGSVRWRYLYASPDTVQDNFSSIARGPDGNIYVCGTAGGPPNCDWVVVSLTASGAIAEQSPSPVARRLSPAATFFRDRIVLRLAPRLSPSAPRLLTLRDAAGRTVLASRIAPVPARVELAGPEISGLAPGSYFLTVDDVPGAAHVLKVR